MSHYRLKIYETVEFLRLRSVLVTLRDRIENFHNEHFVFYPNFYASPNELKRPIKPPNSNKYNSTNNHALLLYPQHHIHRRHPNLLNIITSTGPQVTHTHTHETHTKETQTTHVTGCPRSSISPVRLSRPAHHHHHVLPTFSGTAAPE